MDTDPKQELADNLAVLVIADGDDYVMTYHEGDVEGIAEGEYWVVSVIRRKLIGAMAELEEFAYAAA